MSNTALATTPKGTTTVMPEEQTQPVTVKSILAQPAYQSRFREVLGDKAQQFMTSLINVSNSMSDVEPNSVIQSSMIAAALDLPIDKNLGFAWIVPYKVKGDKFAQFQMGYKGYVQLGLRSGQYKRMNARAINEAAFGGFDEVGEPTINWDKLDETKPVVGYVFAFQLVNGFVKIAYWPKTRVEAHANRYSQSFKGGFDSPWKSNFDEMALKTVIKNELSKWGILSIQMQKALESDSGVIDAEGTISFADNEPAKIAPNFAPPPKLLATPVGNPETGVTKSDDGDLGPQTATATTPVASPAPAKPIAQETKAQMATRMLNEAGVSIEDFRDFLQTKGFIRDGSVIGSWDDVPESYFVKMSDKTLAEAIRTFGKK